MAPPPASLPLTQRLVALAKTLQFAWFAGHLTLIVCVLRYALSWARFNYYSTMAQLCYRLTFISAAATYGIVVYKTMRARAKMQGSRLPNGPLGLIVDENVQYLVMALIWLLSPQYPLAMLPYAIYSFFHVLTYARGNLIPTLQPVKLPPADGNSNSSPAQSKPVSPLAEIIGGLVRDHYDSSMYVVSSLEMMLWFRLLLAAVFFRPRSWVLLALYTVFLRARYAQSSHVQHAFGLLEARGDALLGAQGTPPAAKQAWDTVKAGARSFRGATDVNRFARGAAPPKKAS